MLSIWEIQYDNLKIGGVTVELYTNKKKKRLSIFCLVLKLEKKTKFLSATNNFIFVYILYVGNKVIVRLK